jgi:hypothetical protein
MLGSQLGALLAARFLGLLIGFELPKQASDNKSMTSAACEVDCSSSSSYVAFDGPLRSARGTIAEAQAPSRCGARPQRWYTGREDVLLFATSANEGGCWRC